MELNKAIKVLPKNTGYYPLKQQAAAIKDTDFTLWDNLTTFTKYHYEDKHNIYIKMAALWQVPIWLTCNR